MPRCWAAPPPNAISSSMFFISPSARGPHTRNLQLRVGRPDGHYVYTQCVNPFILHALSIRCQCNSHPGLCAARSLNYYYADGTKKNERKKERKKK